MRTFLICGLVCGLAAGAAVGQVGPAGPAQSGPAQTTTVTMPPTPLLPDHVWGLKAAKSDRGEANTAPFGPRCDLIPEATADAASEHCQPLAKEDGLRRWAVGTYADGGRKVQVFAMQFEDATSAFSAYTFYRSQMHGVRVSGAEARLGKAANEMSVDADGTLVWAETAVMRIAGHVSQEELIALTAGLPKVGGRRGVAPLLPTLIPGAGLEAGTVRYAIGPAGYQAMGGVLPADQMGWDKSVEVATADYRGKGTLTLLLCPTPQIAGERLRAIQAAVNQPGSPKLGTVVLRRVGPLLGVTTGAWTEAQAKVMLAGVHLNQEISFDQKMPLEFHAEIRKTATLLQNIAIFSGILIFAAILLGLFLGGARAGIRKLQGKPAHSEPEFLSISLKESETEHFKKLESHEEGGKQL